MRKEALAHRLAFWDLRILPFPLSIPGGGCWLHHQILLPFSPQKSPTPWAAFEQENVTRLLPKSINNETPVLLAAPENN